MTWLFILGGRLTGGVHPYGSFLVDGIKSHQGILECLVVLGQGI